MTRFQLKCEQFIKDGRCKPEKKHKCRDCMDLGVRYHIVKPNLAISFLPVASQARCHCDASLRWSEKIAFADELDAEAMEKGTGRITWYTKYDISIALKAAVDKARAAAPPEEGDLG